jgi:hypothetical protein
MNTKLKPIPVRTKKMTKEEFLIQWVMLRASFREDFSGTAAARAADDVWNEIQRLKNK